MLDYFAENYLTVAEDLEHAGLKWMPEIGDEISPRSEPEKVSILFDSQGLTPLQLREIYMWLPSVEQLVLQFEARQAVLSHAGLEMHEAGFYYKAVLKYDTHTIEARAESLKIAMGVALRNLLLAESSVEVH